MLGRKNSAVREFRRQDYSFLFCGLRLYTPLAHPPPGHALYFAYYSSTSMYVARAAGIVQQCGRPGGGEGGVSTAYVCICLWTSLYVVGLSEECASCLCKKNTYILHLSMISVTTTTTPRNVHRTDGLFIYRSLSPAAFI